MGDGEEEVNSADEHERAVPARDVAQLERRFAELMAAQGLQIRRMAEDGNCMFRAVADRMYGDAEMHDVVRRLCMDYIQKERDYFSPYVTQDFESYVQRKRRDGIFGNHLELQAMSELFNRRIAVYAYSDEPINTFQAPSAAPSGDASTEPLRLSFHGRNHYNVLVDPNRPDVGLGLGLPGMDPGLADRMQVNQAARESEQAALEQQILSAAADASDAAATQDALEAEVMRVSYEEAMRHGDAQLHEGAVMADSDDVASEMGQEVQQLVAMGFDPIRAAEAAALFVGDLGAMTEFLTNDS